jgi:hypothetical protein
MQRHSVYNMSDGDRKFGLTRSVCVCWQMCAGKCVLAMGEVVCRPRKEGGGLGVGLSFGRRLLNVNNDCLT